MNLIVIFASILFIFINISLSEAVSHFSSDIKAKRFPAQIEFNDIWFYSSDGSKVIPDIDTEWITVVFRSRSGGADYTEDIDERKNQVINRAKPLIKEYNELKDFFYDINIAEDACFFRIEKNTSKNSLKSLIQKLNENSDVDYVHPAIRLNDTTYGFFNAINLKWKTGAGKNSQDLLASKLHSLYEEKNNIYRVNIFEIPFFKAVNFFAEDINVAEASPYLVKLEPSLRLKLSLGINGGNLGDAIPFTLTVAFSDFIKIDPSSIANINLKPNEIQKELFDIEFDTYDYAKAALKSPIVITGRMRFYAPGEFVIPPVNITYTCTTCSDTQVRTSMTEAIIFKTASIVSTKEPERKLIIPTNDLPQNFDIEDYVLKARTSLLIFAVSILAVFLLIGWIWKRQKDIRAEDILLKKLKPDALILERLKTLLNITPPKPHWLYIKEIINLLREYLVARYNIPQEPFGGSGSTFFESVRHMIPGNKIKNVKTVLYETDNIIAAELKEYGEIDKFKSDMAEIININES
ncbi:MAG: hypothetical protein HZA77_07785 [Candidatus Schekmanbacteria bacterium]|nr:hypothetical protein [Candidatus Schekmanbacteria bacterium]